MDGLSSADEAAAVFDLNAGQSAALARYADLILAWRQSNITAVRTPEEIAHTLIGDALSLLDVAELRRREGEEWVDLGAGAGLPGIPLAIALPNASMTLLESVGKKCRFLEAAVDVAGIAARSRVACARSEEYAAKGQQGREAFGVVLARAVAPLPVLLELASPLLQVGGVLVASKTHRALAQESGAGEHVAPRCGLLLKEIIVLPRSPLHDGACVVYEKMQPTPDLLPRREGMAGKRPLGKGAPGSSPSSAPASIEGREKGVW